MIAPPSGRLRWQLMVLLIFPITFVMSLDRTAMAVASPIIQRQFGFTLVDMSLILTAFTWCYALLQVPGGWLAERVGPRRSLFWASLLWSVLTAAPSRVGHLLQPDLVPLRKVQLVRMVMRSMSDVTSSGGFSSAPAYCRSWR